MRELDCRETWKYFQMVVKGRDGSNRRNYHGVTVEQVHGRMYFYTNTKFTYSRIIIKEQQIFNLFGVA